MISGKIDVNDFKYQSLSNEELQKKCETFLNTVDVFVEYNKIVNNVVYDIECNVPMIYDIIERIDQRKDYFHYFHSKESSVTEISQAKEVGLLCYWISKYKPLRFKNFFDEQEYYLHKGYSINESFAVFIMESFVLDVKEEAAFFFTENNKTNFVYSLFNRDFSKEALMTFTDSFVE